ncbi:hypothetical protein EI94DRAFT_522352 [Lactarius quietus]|nr:hypothetical protein EI94DRAFT_522352 [Lactarius quietus]
MYNLDMSRINLRPDNRFRRRGLYNCGALTRLSPKKVKKKFRIGKTIAELRIWKEGHLLAEVSVLFVHQQQSPANLTLVKVGDDPDECKVEKLAPITINYVAKSSDPNKTKSIAKRIRVRDGLNVLDILKYHYTIRPHSLLLIEPIPSIAREWLILRKLHYLRPTTHEQWLHL